MTAREVVLRLEEITKRFGKLAANDDVAFALHRGEVLALPGENGAGKTTLMNILFGHYTADAGTVEVFGKALPPGAPGAALAAGVGRIPEDRHATGSITDFTLTENAVLEGYARQPFARAGWMDRGRARGHAEAIIAKYDIRCPGPEARIRLLSGGLAAMAGFSEVAGLRGSLTLDLSPGFGHTGIVVAMLALLHPLGIVVSAIFVAGVFVGANSISRAAEMPTYIADILVATALLFMVLAILLTRFRVVRG